MNEYDEYLVGYQRAAVATEAIAATLNAGQAVVLASGLTAVLVAAATATAPGTFTAGDLVSFPDILAQCHGRHLASHMTACDLVSPYCCSQHLSRHLRICFIPRESCI